MTGDQRQNSGKLSNKWFITVIIIECRVSESNTRRVTCDEQFRLISASSSEEAYEKAIALGAAEEVSYLNNKDQKVEWTFVGLNELTEIDEGQLSDGVELFSRLIKVSKPARLVSPKHRLSVFLGKTDQ